jgi:hypothetical protein
MRRFVLLFLITALTVPISLPVAASTEISISTSDRNTAYELIRQATANFFGVRTSDIDPYISRNNPETVFPVFFLAAESGKSPSYIWREKGQGWGKLAKSLGLPADFHGRYISNQHKKKHTPLNQIDNATFEELMSLRFLVQYYGKDRDYLYKWRGRGLGCEDLVIGSNLAARLDKPQGGFFEDRLAKHDWAYIAKKNKIAYSSLSQPVAPKEKLKVKLAGEPTPTPKQKNK